MSKRRLTGASCNCVVIKAGTLLPTVMRASSQSWPDGASKMSEGGPAHRVHWVSLNSSNWGGGKGNQQTCIMLVCGNGPAKQL
jgi:hypothetical protein